MKKLLIVVLIIVLINLFITIIILNKSEYRSNTNLTNVFPDTTVTNIRIDSVTYNIKGIDSTIIKYNDYEKEIENKVLSLDDSSTVVLFYELIRSSSTGVGDSIRVDIDDLRIANTIIAKSYTKDTIIQLKDSLIKTQNIKINYLSNSYEEMKRYASASELARNRLEDNLNKSKKRLRLLLV